MPASLRPVYQITLVRSAERDLRKIPGKDLKKVLKRIEALAFEPRAPGHVKLAGEELYRIRQGNHRVIYAIEDEILRILVIAAGH